MILLPVAVTSNMTERVTQRYDETCAVSDHHGVAEFNLFLVTNYRFRNHQNLHNITRPYETAHPSDMQIRQTNEIDGFTLFVASLLKPVDADVSRRKKLLLRRMEEDKQIGPQTCIIMQRLLEEKHRQRTISTGSLNNGIITHDNILIKERDLGNYSSASRSLDE